MPLAATHLASCFHSAVAMAAVQAACTVRAVAGVYTHMVRRIPWWRTTDRASCNASPTAVSDGVAMRAASERYTVAGSVLCTATSDSVSSATSSLRALPASRCRRPRRVRRCASVKCGNAIGRVCHDIPAASCETGSGGARLAPMRAHLTTLVVVLIV